MPIVNGVTVTNTTTNVTWNSGGFATVYPATANHTLRVLVNAGPGNQPPGGFVNDPAHLFRVQGRYVDTGAPFVAAGLTPNAEYTEPPGIYAFSL
jgi:hypothetical protein